MTAAHDSKEIPEVTAIVETDMCLLIEPNQVEGQIDATGYLEQASDEKIEALIASGLGGDYESDAVYQHVASLNSKKPKDERDPLIDHLEARIAGEVTDEDELLHDEAEIPDDARGFEVHVDEDEFKAWLEARRPHLTHLLGANAPKS
jgi:hypothetical protein